MSNNWWANKLGQQQAQPRQEMPAAPSQIPMARMPQPVQQPATFLPSSGGVSTCPSCRSKNYMKVGSQVTATGAVDAWRCYDCGYPIVQRGSGMSGISAPASGPTQAAIQVPTAGWQGATNVVEKM
jgi:hypothetical protein